MWRKFLNDERTICKTILKIIALNFRKPDRVNWSEEEKDQELEFYLLKLQDKEFIKFIGEYPVKYFYNQVKTLQDWIGVADERLEDILRKQRQIDLLNLQLNAQNDTINQLILRTSLKRQIILRIKRLLPKQILKQMVKIKRLFFGPVGIDHL
ncbi:MAG: hypothetical protein WCP73_00510 [Eubacteriales bacterium]